MEHEHTEHVAAPPNQVFAAIADPENLPHYVPQLTAVQRADGDKLTVEARYEGHTQRGEAWFRADESKLRIEWGAPTASITAGFKLAPTQTVRG